MSSQIFNVEFQQNKNSLRSISEVIFISGNKKIFSVFLLQIGYIL